MGLRNEQVFFAFAFVVILLYERQIGRSIKAELCFLLLLWSQTGGTEVTLESVDVMTFPFVGVFESLSKELEFLWSFPGSLEMLPLPLLILFRILSDLEFCLIRLDEEFVLDGLDGFELLLPVFPLPLLLPPTAVTRFRLMEVGVSDFNALPNHKGRQGERNCLTKINYKTSSNKKSWSII